MRLLLEEGAEVDASFEDGRTPLSCVAENGDVSTTSLLLKYGAQTHISDSSSKLLIDYAREAGNEAIVKLLQEAIS